MTWTILSYPTPTVELDADATPPQATISGTFVAQWHIVYTHETGGERDETKQDTFAVDGRATESGTGIDVTLGQ